jgi:hypothetical protein
MFRHKFPVFAVAALLTACTDGPSPRSRLDESKRLPLPCRAESKEVAGTWYVNIDRHPNRPQDQPEKFASGAFDARVTLWVTFETGQQLVTVHVGANVDGAGIDSGEVSTGRMITGEKIVSVDDPRKCEAFRPRA